MSGEFTNLVVVAACGAAVIGVAVAAFGLLGFAEAPGELPVGLRLTIQTASVP